MESSATEMRESYRRFFAWTIAVTLTLLLGLVAVEIIFPEAIRSYPDSNALAKAPGGAVPDALGLDLYDLQLLLMVAALVSCVASIVGLAIVAMVDSVESRKVRRRRAVEARLHHYASRSGQQAPAGAALSALPSPRNARIRALREVAHEKF